MAEESACADQKVVEPAALKPHLVSQPLRPEVASPETIEPPVEVEYLRRALGRENPADESEAADLAATDLQYPTLYEPRFDQPNLDETSLDEPDFDDLVFAEATIETTTEPEISVAPVPVLAAFPEIAAPVEDNSTKSPAEFALDLVLNEIVLQARLTTNATGAVFGLARNNELLCRATTGATAAEVAVCLRAKSGIAATCFAAGAVHRVDDLGSDPNEDAVAYRRNGVRSVLVVPVQGERGPALGILEIFSPRPNAFCDRDVMTLQALARRIAANVQLVQQSYGQNSPSTGSNYQPAQTRVTAWPGKSGGSDTPIYRYGRPKRKSRSVLSRVIAKRSVLQSADWISAAAKSSIGLALFAGAIMATECWVHGGGIEALYAPFSQTFTETAQRAPASKPSLPVPLSIKVPVTDLSEWTAKAASQPVTKATITIERQPLHPASSVVKENDPATGKPKSEKHKTASAETATQATKTASKDPAAAALPNKAEATGDSKTGLDMLTSDAAMARLVQRVEPEYPNAARQQRISGTVILDVIVNETGTVEGLSMVSGESQLMTAAAQAVRQWRFQPLVKKGQPVKFESRIAIDFTLVTEGH